MDEGREAAILGGRKPNGWWARLIPVNKSINGLAIGFKRQRFTCIRIARAISVSNYTWTWVVTVVTKIQRIKMPSSKIMGHELFVCIEPNVRIAFKIAVVVISLFSCACRLLCTGTRAGNGGDETGLTLLCNRFAGFRTNRIFCPSYLPLVQNITWQ